MLGDVTDEIPNAGQATVAQLLNHTSGIPSWEDDPAWIRAGRGDRLDVAHTWGKAETLQYIAGSKPLAEAGQHFSYANTNFTLLGLIIENHTGREVMHEIRQRILDPLGLENIYLEGFEPVPGQRVPHRYHWATADFVNNAGINAAFPEIRPGLIDASASNLSVEWTAGGMVATMSDLALYGRALREGRLLDENSMAFMMDWFPIKEGLQNGHNLFRTVYQDGHATIGHSGGVLGFTAALYWVEGTDVVVAVGSNVGSMHAGKVPASASAMAASRDFVELAMTLARAD